MIFFCFLYVQLTKANSPLHSPLVGNPTVIQGLDLDTTRPKIDENMLGKYRDFNSQKGPSMGSVIDGLRKSSEELNGKVKLAKPTLTQLSTSTATAATAASSTTTSTSTSTAQPSEAPKQKETKKEIKIVETPKETTTSATITTTTTTTTTTIPSTTTTGTSFKIGFVFKPKPKVLEPNYPVSIRGNYFSTYKYNNNDGYPSWPQNHSHQTQQYYPQYTVYQQMPQIAPIIAPYGYPYNAYYHSPQYYQPYSPRYPQGGY